MCSPGANLGKPPRQVFVIQLDEARAELERRNAEKKRREGTQRTNARNDRCQSSANSVLSCTMEICWTKVIRSAPFRVRRITIHPNEELTSLQNGGTPWLRRHSCSLPASSSCLSHSAICPGSFSSGRCCSERGKFRCG